MSDNDSKSLIDPHYNRILSDDFFASGLTQFPKVCKKCHTTYFDYSDWFASNILGSPMVFKRTQLLFFRGCRCSNTLAMSMDFGKVLHREKGIDEFNDNQKLVQEFKDLFISEIPYWKATSGRNTKNNNLIINTSDLNLIQKILPLDLGHSLEDAIGQYFKIKVDAIETCRLYTCDSPKIFCEMASAALEHNKNFACGVLILTKENVTQYTDELKKIHQFDPLFQIITYSESLSSVKQYGLDDNFHNNFSSDDESLPFMLINRLNSYYYLQ